MIPFFMAEAYCNDAGSLREKIDACQRLLLALTLQLKNNNLQRVWPGSYLPSMALWCSNTDSGN